VLVYTSRLIIATQPGQSAGTLVNRYVRYGAGPRGAQAIIMGAKAIALMAGRFNVSFDDVAAIAPAALRHRILLNFEGLAEGIRSDDIIAELLQLAEPAYA
ncbi:MAG TPA: AAA family ATPase, partial [Promineifilum sp.]|nr:AAA family ATPase [Promineifilum sp.]